MSKCPFTFFAFSVRRASAGGDAKKVTKKNQGFSANG
jgi:hypothetical protein